MGFSKEIISWYLENKRDLPWRKTKNPFKIWLSEIILQQTRVNQGIPYYYKFIKAFPNITKLAEANEDSVLKLWQGLGYYSRARNLHHTAKHIAFKLNGKFPNTYKEIRNLKGIGDYTAAAISSIAYDLVHPSIDGNVYRTLSRLFSINTPIDCMKGKKEFLLLSEELIDQQRPGIYNQALMEFGATVCTPKKPKCTSCIFQNSCSAYKENKVNEFPVKQKKIKQRARYFDYFIVHQKGNIHLQKRTEKDIWQNLYEFPLIESTQHHSKLNMIKSSAFENLFQESTITVNSVSKIYKHQLSHQLLHARFWKITGSLISDNLLQVPLTRFEQFPVPKLIDKFVTENGL